MCRLPTAASHVFVFMISPDESTKAVRRSSPNASLSYLTDAKVQYKAQGVADKMQEVGIDACVRQTFMSRLLVPYLSPLD